MMTESTIQTARLTSPQAGLPCRLRPRLRPRLRRRGASAIAAEVELENTSSRDFEIEV